MHLWRRTALTFSLRVARSGRIDARHQPVQNFQREEYSVRAKEKAEAIGTLVLPGFTLGNVSMHFKENGVGSLDYNENRNGVCLEVARSNGVAKFDQQVCLSKALQAAVCMDADCNSQDCNSTSNRSSPRMEGDQREWSRSDSSGRSRGSTSSSSLKALENVVMQVLESVRASGYDGEVCDEFREHFARLPSRYTIPSYLFTVSSSCHA